MGFFSAELESMVELYQRETAELMEEFDAKQAGAMQENRFSGQDINAFFRVVHTIKSSAAMMGLSDISSCTHRMEDFFLLFRNHPELAKGQENRIFDLMYRFSDYLEKENERVSKEDFKPTSAASVLDAIGKEIDFFGRDRAVPEKRTEEHREQTVPLPQAEKVPDTNDGTESMLRVVLRPNCQMENVRAYMLVQQIRELCGTVKTQPENFESPDAAARIAADGLKLFLRAAKAEEAARKLSASPYVLRVEKTGQEEKQSSAAGTLDKDAEGGSRGKQSKYSMVSWTDILRLQNITGELITANTILGAAIRKQVRDGALENEFQTMNRLFHELEKQVAAVSMLSVSSAMPQYQRLVRDVATREGKEIRFKISGDELEIDRNLLDLLANPLVHLLRNAADHGIESPEKRRASGKDPCGTVVLKFENMSDHLCVTVEDDGAGMDPQRLLKKAAERGLLTKDESQYSTEEILNLAFLPGLSTNEQTNQFSGRGVGMDVAQNIVSELGGSVKIGSTPGKGTSVRMEVPVSVTSSECIRFSVGSYVCLLPIRCVVRILSYAGAERNLQSIDGRLWLQTEKMLPVLDLFRLYGADAPEKDRRLIIMKDAAGSAALLTGPVTGQQTAVEKQLPAFLGRNYRSATGMIGCTVTETGRLGFMLSADRLIRICGKETEKDGNEGQ